MRDEVLPISSNVKTIAVLGSACQPEDNTEEMLNQFLGRTHGMTEGWEKGGSGSGDV